MVGKLFIIVRLLKVKGAKKSRASPDYWVGLVRLLGCALDNISVPKYRIHLVRARFDVLTQV